MPILSSLFFPFKENDYQEFAFVIQTYKGPFIRSDAIMKPSKLQHPCIVLNGLASKLNAFLKETRFCMVIRTMSFNKEF